MESITLMPVTFEILSSNALLLAKAIVELLRKTGADMKYDCKNISISIYMCIHISPRFLKSFVTTAAVHETLNYLKKKKNLQLSINLRVRILFVSSSLEVTFNM